MIKKPPLTPKLLVANLLFWFAFLITAVTTFFILLIQLPFETYYWSELIEAFYFQYGFFYALSWFLFALALVVAGKPIWQKHRTYPVLLTVSIIGAIIILVSVQMDMPWFHPPRHAVGPAQPGMIRIIQHNAFWYMTDNRGVVKMLRDTPADIVGLEEVDNENLTAIDKAHLNYPYRVGGSHLGLLLLSRWPIESSKIVEPYPGFPSLLASVRLPDKRLLSVILVHPPHATEPYTFHVQQDVFNTLIANKPKLTTPLILLGDVNATPFNYTLKRFIAQMNLKNTRVGQGLLPSWPSYLPKPLRIPIDHILVSQDLEPVSLQLLESTGSDHIPLYLVVK